MFFHASLTVWGGFVDVFSMYTFTSFLSVYTVRRMVASEWVWIAYVVMVAGFTALEAVVSSVVSIAILVALYAATEIAIGVRTRKVLQGTRFTIGVWSLGIASIGVALFFWASSATGRWMCDPASAFQGHGVWHVLAGVAATCLYFFWRAETKT